MIQGKFLGDLASHGMAGDVSPFDAEVFEESGGIVRHLLDRECAFRGMCSAGAPVVRADHRVP